jgi:hypothetical protein
MRWATAVCFVAACSFKPASPITGGGGGGGGGGAGGGGGDAPGSATAGWAHKRQLTINNSDLNQLDSFPLLVILDDTRIHYSATGADLRFADAGGAQLAYEIETWNPSGKSYVWVNVPTIAAMSMTDIWMYYDNPSATDDQMPALVWDASFIGVWHLVDAHDSTGHNTSVNMGAVSATGEIGGAMSFDGNAAHYIDTGASAHPTTWTVEAWVNPGSPSVAGAPNGTSIIARWPNYLLLWSCNDSVFCHSGLFDTVESGATTFTSAYSASSGSWSHVAAAFDGSALTAYADEVAGTPDTGPQNQTPQDTSGAFQSTATIGVRNDLAGAYAGTIDEVRISNIGRSADYMKASTRAGLDTYVTYGPELAAP